jgi:universal stress protein E
VLRSKHDLVVAGTRDLTSLRRMLFGSTTMKLLRRCPCPVLVTRPLTFASGLLGAGLHRRAGDGGSPLKVLVATDLKPASEEALRLGIALARQLKARVYVLHVVEYKLDDVCNTGLPDAKQDEYRRKVRADAQEALQAQLERTEYRALGARLEVHLAGDVGLPDVAIQHFLQVHNIHLLVMGTIGRGGIRGIMIGNTAERLLPEVHCSVLAVKPHDFVCPVEE